MRRRGPIESWKSKSKGVSPFIPPPGVYSLDAVMKRWVLVIIITMTIIIFLSSRQLSFAWCRRRRKRTTIPFHYSKQIGQWARIHIQCLYSFSWSSFNKRRPSTLTTDTSLFDLSNTYVCINKDGHFLFFPLQFPWLNRIYSFRRDGRRYGAAFKSSSSSTGLTLFTC